MEQDFLGYLYDNGLITKSQQEQILSRGETLAEKQAEIIAEMGIVSAEKIHDQLLHFEMDSIIQENIIDLPEDDNFEDEFIKKYAEIFCNGLHKNATYGEIETLHYLESDIFVYQTLLGKDDESSVLIGISSDTATLKALAENFYNHRPSSLLEAQSPAETDEDALDFFTELLNSINGACTYKFNIPYDLDIPSYLENITVASPKIYKLTFFIDSRHIDLCIIHGTKYEYERM